MNPEVTVENYEQLRNELIEANSNLHAIVLRENEKKLDKLLSELKEEYNRESGRSGYDMPVLTDEKLRSSRLYEFCRRLPKGADLHVHDMALLPAKELIPLLAECPEFFINADRSSFDLALADESGNAPEGYINFSEALKNGYYTPDELIENWTFAKVEGTDARVWDFFENLFDKQSVLSDNAPFAAKYYDRAFRYYCENGIMHVEIHLMLTESIDESGEYLKTLRDAYYGVKKDYPYFTVKVIGAGVKADNENIDFTKKCFLNASYAQEIVKDTYDPEHITDFLIGFDLVNEEDTSLPLHAFAPMLLKVKRQYPSMKLYIHGGESLDAENLNLIDAYLLGVSRVGHGLNLYRYPDLHSKFIKAEICLEVCPISNQKLGYTRDIRNHPATEYLRSGMAIALCSDDPAYMENITLTDDFFAATVGWNLGIRDLKQLGINSLMYSGLDEKEKFASLKEYNRLWNEFVDSMVE